MSLPGLHGDMRARRWREFNRLRFNDRMTAYGRWVMTRTAIREALDADVIGAQLARQPAGSLGAACHHATFIEQRAVMMQAWGEYLATVAERTLIWGFGI